MGRDLDLGYAALMTIPSAIVLATLWTIAVASVILVVRFWRRPCASEPLPTHLLDLDYWKDRPIHANRLAVEHTPIEAGKITASKIEADSER